MRAVRCTTYITKQKHAFSCTITTASFYQDALIFEKLTNNIFLMVISPTKNTTKHKNILLVHCWLEPANKLLQE